MLSHRHGEYTVPRGAKKDITVSKLLYENGLFLDKRSFISLGAEPHLYLKGPDMQAQHDRVMKRDKHRCQICERSYWSDFGGSLEVDHIIPKGRGGSDDIGNLQAACISCHRTGPNAKHVRPRLKRIPMEVEP
jgi:hypothetical protein